MIVYGDSPIAMSLRGFAAGYDLRLARSSCRNLEEARIRLVLAGQLEQAVTDGSLDCAARCRALTAAAAEAFLEARRGASSARSEGRLEQAARAVGEAASRAAGDARLEIRTPEGFAWYGLYPDAYAQAAERWAEARQAACPVVVIGIRSIGTSLAAVVAAVLKSRGFETTDLTVRPAGHPFDRRTVLPPDLPRADQAIIVDEGPGLSGSSMASVAEALMARGYPAGSVSFFPGHGMGPGARASPKVHRRWAEAPVFLVPWPETQLEGKAASELLAERTGERLPEPVETPLREIGGGRWREAVRNEACHALAPVLEQPKLLAGGRSGTAAVLKFAGFALAPGRGAGPLATGSERQAQKLAQLAAEGFTVRPLGSAHGWLIFPWVNGRRLGPGSMDSSILQRVGTYIARAAGPPLPPAEREAARERLHRILFWNTRELLGEEAAGQAARAGASECCEPGHGELPSYGDGRLAPHEWIATEASLLKLDAGGHDHDHTAVGRQPIWWDLAGASVEWDLGEEGADLLAAVAGIAGRSPVRAAYHRAAYAAFRAGIADLCLGSSPAESPDRQVFSSALAYYRRRLQRELDRLGSLIPARSTIHGLSPSLRLDTPCLSFPADLSRRER